MNKKKVILIFSVVLVVFLLVFVLKNNVDGPDVNNIQTQNDIEINNIASSSDENTASSTIDNIDINYINTNIDTSDWITYKNDEYGFELKYPVDWRIREEGPNDLGRKYGLVMLTRKDHAIEDLGIFIQSSREERVTFSEELKELSSYESLAPIIIDGYKTYLSYSRKELEKYSYKYFIEVDGMYLRIDYKSSREENKNLIFQIFKTIKFLKEE